MTKIAVFLFFWVTMTVSLALGDLLMFALLLPTFLLLYTEAESLEYPCTEYYARQEPKLEAEHHE